TELFSAKLANKGHSVDWHMQAMNKASSGWIQITPNERVCVGRSFGGRSLWHKALNQLSGLRHDLRLYSLALKRHYDFIQVRDKIFAAFIALLAARLHRIPFYYWMSFPYPEADLYRAADKEMNLPFLLRVFYRLRGHWTGWLLYRVVLPQASHVFVQSDRMKADVAAKGIAQEKMTAVPMGINLDRIDTTAVTPLSENSARLVYTGSLVRLRRIDFLLDVLKRVQTRIPHAELVLVGEGLPRDMQFLEAEAARLGVNDSVRFVGFVPTEQAWAFVRDADVCLSPLPPNPILDCGTPTKVIEYMALNKPVVANRHPDQSKVLNESGAGFAVDYDAQSFADAVVELLSNPTVAAQMGARGLLYVRQHRSYDALATALELQYLRLLGWRTGQRAAIAVPQ
ncbi:MAG TPA: glycosyltransferase family 4 protein, partial [Burkholderiales bacterium]|nr:glycosyltransferase family 4 protein [Burkholderiales bacterium]